MSNNMKTKRNTQRKNVTRSLELKSRSSEDVIGKRTISGSVECEKKPKKSGGSIRKNPERPKYTTGRKRVGVHGQNLSLRKEIGQRASLENLAKIKLTNQNSITSSLEKDRKSREAHEPPGLISPDGSQQGPVQPTRKKSTGDVRGNGFRRLSSNLANNAANNGSPDGSQQGPVQPTRKKSTGDARGNGLRKSSSNLAVNNPTGLTSPDSSQQGPAPAQPTRKKSTGDVRGNGLRKNSSNLAINAENSYNNNNAEEEEQSDFGSKRTMILDDKSWERCESDRSKTTFLRKWIDTKLLGGLTLLKTEFKAAPVDISAEECKMFYKNSESNRYPNIPCLDKTRLILIDDDKLYIHANRVRACSRWDRFVCTQGPLPNTINDFWKMIQSLQATFIVMLCSFTESGTVKCSRYFPEAGCYLETETFSILTESISDWNFDGDRFGDKVLQSKLKYVNKLNGKEGRLTHYQWLNWPDHGTPESCDTTLKLLAAVRRSRHPTVVHCSAGVGRTGTFVLVESIIQSLCNPKYGKVDECFPNLRKDRAKMVQTFPQYVYAIRCSIEYFISKGCPTNEEQWSAFKDQITKFLGGHKKKKTKVSKTRKAGSGSAEDAADPSPGGADPSPGVDNFSEPTAQTNHNIQ